MITTQTAADTTLNEDISRGFDHGNYANAYETEDLETMLEGIEDESEAYRQAAILGFFGSYDLHEIPGSDRAAFDVAYFSAAGKACVAAGYCESRADAYSAEQGYDVEQG